MDIEGIQFNNFVIGSESKTFQLGIFNTRSGSIAAEITHDRIAQSVEL